MIARLDIAKFKEAISRRLKPSASKMGAIADVALAQIRKRFETGGQSGGASWPPTKTPLGHKPPLDGLAKTFHASGSEGHAEVSSAAPFIDVHQKGATIQPKTAKRLFVPLSEKGKRAYEARNNATPIVQRIYAGSAWLETPELANDGLEYGVDYVLVKQVAIPQREMLPDSDAERAEHAKAAAHIVAHGPPTTPLAEGTDLASLFDIDIEGNHGT